MQHKARDKALSRGFKPIARPDATILILGSLPSQRSIQSGEYFGNPHNVFWKIMGKLVAAGPELPYAARVERMIDARLAVWDVLRSARRPGSLDANIDRETARPNHFVRFLEEHPEVQLVCFNGKKAAALFKRLVIGQLSNWDNGLEFVTLPSTSPAHAAMAFEEKLRQWSVVRLNKGWTNRGLAK